MRVPRACANFRYARALARAQWAVMLFDSHFELFLCLFCLLRDVVL